MDKLEKFIMDNKESFDTERKPEQGWNRLAKKLTSQPRNFMLYWKVAAVVFFVSTVGLSVLRFGSSEEPRSQAVAVGTLEGFYLQQISRKAGEYRQLAGDDAALLEDLEAFDAAYAELSDSFTKVRNEQLAEAMLENLRLRILILNEQIELIKHGKADDEMNYHSS